MNTLPELKEEELRAFFQEHFYAIVGEGVRASNCPITRFYSEKYGVAITTTRIHITYYPQREESQRKEIDPWVKDFVRILDRRCGDNYVTGEECLEVLDKALMYKGSVL